MNMSTFICPHCCGESHIFGHGGAEAEAQRRNIPFLGHLPLSLDLRTLSDDSKVMVHAAPESDVAQIFIRTAKMMMRN